MKRLINVYKNETSWVHHPAVAPLLPLDDSVTDTVSAHEARQPCGERLDVDEEENGSNHQKDKG
jgi:hypothetical protein